MKLLTICVLAAIATLPLPGAAPPPDNLVSTWQSLASQAQSQFDQNQFADAEETGQAMLRLAKHLPPDDSKLAATYHFLGTINRDWGHCAAAHDYYSRAIGVWRKQERPEPRSIFNSIVSLIGGFCECDEFKAAEKAFHTYASDLQRYRSTPGDEARLLATQATLARGKNNYARAEGLFRQAIALMESNGEFTPVEIASHRGSLAVMIDAQGRHEEALAETQKVIEFFEKNDSKHPSLVATLNNAACSLADLRRMDESQRVFERAMTTAEELYGHASMLTARIMLNYARVLRENKEAPAAAEWLKRGTEAFQRSLRDGGGTVDMETLRITSK